MLHLANFIGLRLVVDYSLLHDLNIHLSQSEGILSIRLEGSIVESAKVVESVEVTPTPGAILVTIYASLAIWNKNGSPDFSVTKPLNLLPGIYDIQYLGKGGERTFLKKVEISNEGIVELRSDS